MRLILLLSFLLVCLIPSVNHAQLTKTKRVEVSVNESGCYHGQVKIFFRNGKVKKTITYVNGYVYGEANYYFRSGELKRSGFLDGTNSLTFRWFKWIPTEHGVWIKWHKDGTRNSEIHCSKILPMAEPAISNTICR